MIRQLLGAAVCIAAVQGCIPKGKAGQDMALQFSDLQPDKIPGESAMMRFGDKEMRTDLVGTRKGQDLILEFRAFGETLEREIYRVSDTEFAILEILDERYMPPLTLIRFPLALSQESKWTGQISTAGIVRKANAKINTDHAGEVEFLESDRIIHVHVDLNIQTGGVNPSVRKLDFWFEPEKGLQRRLFGKELERRPAPVELN